MPGCVLHISVAFGAVSAQAAIYTADHPNHLQSDPQYHSPAPGPVGLPVSHPPLYTGCGAPGNLLCVASQVLTTDNCCRHPNKTTSPADSHRVQQLSRCAANPCCVAATFMTLSAAPTSKSACETRALVPASAGAAPAWSSDTLHPCLYRACCYR